eukprot:TRINITY_DN12694_c0_g1_i1.p3 TRINITY_DN12694_c0_g1~~TRINITY_DN12694_c0_g1_i1.p3  ORF type:complete len:121 (+),score=19.99 TRINITY_DN12694_c0_g1_i1:159-521(+)
MATARFVWEFQFKATGSWTVPPAEPRDEDGSPADAPHADEQPELATRPGPSPSWEPRFQPPASAEPAGWATGVSDLDAFHAVDGGLVEDGPPTAVFGRTAASDAAGGLAVDAETAKAHRG